MTKKSFINVPTKGIMSDLDKSRIPQDRCTVSENVRFFDENDGDFVGRPAMGNDNAFQLSSGFVYHGHIEIGDISFIFSKNDDGLFEVGSFPSPKQLTGFTDAGVAIIDTSLIGFKDEYQPLCTYKNKERLRTALLDFNPDKFCQGVSKIIYDGTYGLYYTDRKNPIRLINSGFDNTGVITDDHDIDDAYFISSINLIQGSASKVSNSTAKVVVGGQLEYATYFFYLRYTTKNLDVSNIISEIGPVLVTRGANNDNTSFSGGNTYVSGELSAKAVELSIVNLDATYEYIEVLFTKFTTDVNGELFYESKLINKKFQATPSMTIKINGVEELIPVTNEDITADYPIEDKAEYLHEHDNMLWGANWVNQSQHSSIVKKFASKTYPSYIKKTFDKTAKYKYSTNDYHERSYFAEEIYPFALKAVLINGTTTYPYPVKGADFYEGGDPNAIYNSEGLIRFPKLELDVNYTRYGDFRMLGIEFDFDRAMFNMTDDEKAWMNKNVLGFIIVQGDRIENRLFSGFGLQVSGSDIIDGDGSSGMYSNNVSIPLFERTGDPLMKDTYYVPQMKRWIEYGTQGNLIQSKEWYNTRTFSRSQFERKIVGIFSPEIMFSKFNFESNIGYCKMLEIETYGQAAARSNSVNGGQTSPQEIRRRVEPANKAYVGMVVEDEEYVGNTENNTPANPSPKFRCINQAFDYYTDPNPTDEGSSKHYSMFYKIDDDYTGDHRTPTLYSNRNLNTPKYLAIKVDEGKEGLVCLYKKNPEDIVVSEMGDSANIIYYEKSPIILLSSLPSSYSMYKGDAFYGAVNAKIMTWDPSNTPAWDNENDNWVTVGVDVRWSGYDSVRYAHGVMASFNGFYDVNIGCRQYTDTKTFYPVSIQNIDHEHYWYVGPRSSYYTYKGQRYLGITLESLLLNKAYSQNRSIRGSYGFDKVSLYDEKVIRAETRIRFSLDTSPGEVKDSWRVFSALSYKDFDRGKGTIVALASIFGKLISIQEDAINQHYVNEKGIKVPSTSGELVLGQGEMLSDRVHVLAEFGAQSDKAMNQVYEKIVGYDVRRNIAWITGVNRDNYRTSITAADITEGGLVINLFKRYVNSSDVVVSTNKDGKEVWFSSANKGATIIFDYSRTIISTVKTFGLTAGISILEDFYTTINSKSFYKENNPERLLNYFGKDHDMRLGVVVNGLSGNENLSNLDKIFERLIIDSAHHGISSVEFNTLNQYSMLAPFYQENAFWRNPKREFSKWVIPVPLQKAEHSYMDQGSEMTGTWMEVIFRVESPENFYIKTIESQFKLKV